MAQQQAARMDSAATLEGILDHDIGIAHILPRLGATDRARLMVASSKLLGCCLCDGRLVKRARLVSAAAAVAGQTAAPARRGGSSLLQRSRGVTELVLDGVPPDAPPCLAQLLSPPPPPPPPPPPLAGQGAGAADEGAGAWAASLASLTLAGKSQWQLGPCFDPTWLRHLSDRAHLPALSELSLEHVRLGAEAAAAVVARLPDLRALRLVGVRDGGLGIVVGGLKSHLMPDGTASALTGLTRLELDSTWPGNRSSEGVDEAFFSGLSSLSSLAVLRVRVPTGSLRLPLGASLPASLQELSLQPVDAEGFAPLLDHLAPLAGGLRRLELGVVQPGQQGGGAAVSLRGLSALRHLEHLAVTSWYCNLLRVRDLSVLTALSALRHLGLGKDVFLEPESPPGATPSLLKGLRSLCLLSDGAGWVFGCAAASASGASVAPLPPPLPHLTALECSMLDGGPGPDLDLDWRHDPTRCPLHGPSRRVAWNRLLELCLDFSDMGPGSTCNLHCLCRVLAACSELRAVQLRTSQHQAYPLHEDEIYEEASIQDKLLPPGSLARLESFRVTGGFIAEVWPSRHAWYRKPHWIALLRLVLARAQATLEVLEFSLYINDPAPLQEDAEEARGQLLAAAARCGRLRRLGLMVTREEQLARLLDALVATPGALRHLETLRVMLHVGLDNRLFEDASFRAEAARKLAEGLRTAGGDHRIVDVRVECHDW
jgi:hypothetical protein